MGLDRCDAAHPPFAGLAERPRRIKAREGPPATSLALAAASEIRFLRRQNFHRALFEVGLLGNWVGRIEGYFVDELTCVEEGNKHQSGRHLVAPSGLYPRADFAATRQDPHLLASSQPTLLSVVRMHEQHRTREGTVKFRHAHGH